MSHNIVLITIDCLRADHVSCLGYHRKTTPTIDELSEKGVLFSTAISNGPYTATSFPSILTSTYALMSPPVEEKTSFLSYERPSIAEIFQKNGYMTAAFHSNPLLSDFFGYDKGFDLFQDHVRKTNSHGFISKHKRKIKRKYANEPRFYRIFKRAESFFSRKKSELAIYLKRYAPYEKAETINREALEWIASAGQNEKNFFIWIHYMDVHTPYLPPQSLLKHISAVRLWRESETKGEVSSTNLKRLIKLYDEEIRYTDHELGVFLKNLQELDVGLHNTSVIVTSDHGDEFMEHGGLGHGPITVRPKLYDELLRVPLVIAGESLPRKKVDNQVSLLDLGPTILELVGLEKSSGFLGKSLVPQIISQSTLERAVISEYESEGERGYSYRTKNWKYILTFNQEPRIELYNLRKDATEQKNVANEKWSKTRTFERKIKGHISMEECINSATLAEKRRIRRKISKIKGKWNL